jgi:hypothetical protein
MLYLVTGGLGTIANLGFVRGAKARLMSAITALGTRVEIQEIALTSGDAGNVESLSVKIAGRRHGGWGRFRIRIH